MLSLYWNIGRKIMEIQQGDENKIIGMLLSTNKNENVVKYTLPEDNKTIFSSEYKLNMPTEQELMLLMKKRKILN